MAILAVQLAACGTGTATGDTAEVAEIAGANDAAAHDAGEGEAGGLPDDAGGGPDDASAAPDDASASAADGATAGGCEGRADGTPCDDGDPCTEATTCLGGECGGGRGLCQCAEDADCLAHEDGDLCNGTLRCDLTAFPYRCELRPGSIVVCDPAADAACTRQRCRPETGKCGAVPRPDGTPCLDDDPCTVESRCKAGVCKGSDASWCQCALDADCAKLEDGDPCNGTLYCDGTVFPYRCRVNPATVVHCPTDQDTACSRRACVPDSGTCRTVPRKDGLPCDDGNDATEGDVCKGGACEPGTDVAACKTTADCAELEDGNRCNGLLYCDKAEHRCVVNPATIVHCPSVKDTACTRNQCIPASGSCAMAPVADATPCEDGDKCTLGDFCLGGACKPGAGFACACKTAADCADKDDGDRCNGLPYCNLATGRCETNPATVVTCKTVGDTDCLKARCRPETGACEPTAEATGTVCDDGDKCTEGETCAAGRCEGGVFVCGCKTNADCPDDGDLCNGLEFCDQSAQPPVCRTSPATVVHCKPAPEGSCVGQVCRPDTGACVPGPVPDLTPCDDGNPCTKDEFCQGVKCVGGVRVCECTTSADCAAKDDGNLCNGTWYCDKSGKEPACRPNPASVVYCPKTSTTPCLADRCDPGTGDCKLMPVKGPASCDDGDACTTSDRCEGGHCKGKAADCDDGNVCTADACDPGNGCTHTLANCDDGNSCTRDRCDPGTGKCAFDAAPMDQRLCDADGSGCTVNDICAEGVCRAGPPVSCTLPTAACTRAACVSQGATSYKCVVLARPDGTDCDDGKACTVGAACRGGACLPGKAERLFRRAIAPPGTGVGGGWGAALGWTGGRVVLGGRVGKGLGEGGRPSGWWLAVADAGGRVGWQQTVPSPLPATEVGIAALVEAEAGDAVVALGTVATKDRGLEVQVRWVRLAAGATPTALGTRRYGEAGADEEVRAAAVAGGRMVYAGARRSGGKRTPLLAQLSGIGQTQWIATGAGVLDGRWEAVLPRPGGRWLLAGWTVTEAEGGAAVAVSLVDGQGKALWSRRHPNGEGPQRAVAMALLPGGDLALVGWRRVGGDDRLLQLRLDADGRRRWAFVRSSGGVRPRALAVRKGEYLVTGGESVSRATGDTDAWLVGLDPLGNVQWEAGHDGGGRDAIEALLAMPGAGVLAAGTTTAAGGVPRGLLLRSDAWGHTACTRAGACRLLPPGACDDGKACTRDACSGAKGCVHEPSPGAVCARGGSCVRARVCQDGKCVVGPDQKLFARVYPEIDGRVQDAIPASSGADDGILAIGRNASGSWRLHRFGRDGERLWSRTPSTPPKTSSVHLCRRSGQGYAIVWEAAGAGGGRALDEQGRAAWIFQPPTSPLGRLRTCAGGDGIVVVGGERTLAGIAEGGKVAWRWNMVPAPSWDNQYAIETHHLAAVPGLDLAAVGAHRRWSLRYDYSFSGGWIARLTPSGEQKWRAYYPLPTRLLQGWSSFEAVTGDGKGDYLVASWGHERRAPTYWWVNGIRSSDGAMRWKARLPGPVGRQIGVLPDGTFVAAVNHPDAAPGKGARILRMARDGTVLFDRLLDLPFRPQIAQSLLPVLPDGGVVLLGTGWTNQAAHPALLRLDAWGHWSCPLAGKCADRTWKDCDDGEPCTVGACEAETGCKGVSSGLCEDGNFCTVDTCTKGACAHAPNPCDDGSACTKGSCSAYKLREVAGNALGLCRQQGIDCDDKNPCTADVCDPKKGCLHPPAKAGTACASDGDPCTVDACDGKKGCAHVQGHKGSACASDGDPCTVDACDGKKGCAHTPMAEKAPCSSFLCGGGAGRCIQGECLRLGKEAVLGCRKDHPAKMCADVLKADPSAGSGRYHVDPDGKGPIPEAVRECDMGGGGWTLWVRDVIRQGGVPWTVPGGRTTSCTVSGPAKGTLLTARSQSGATLVRRYLELPPHARVRLRLSFQTYAYGGKNTAFQAALRVRLDGDPKPEMAFGWPNSNVSCGGRWKTYSGHATSPHTAETLLVKVSAGSNPWVMWGPEVWVQ